VGIEPERTDPGLDLSPALQARFTEYLAAAVEAMQDRRTCPPSFLP
jgi:hypothetical protein